MGQPIKLTQPFIPLGSLYIFSIYLHGLRRWRPLKRQTRATCGCMCGVQSSWLWAWAAA